MYDKRSKSNAGKSKVIVIGREEGLECEINEMHLEHVSEFKYLRCVLDKSGTDKGERSKKLVSGRMVAGAISSLVNTRSLQLQCARVLHESLLVPVLMYGSEIMI